MTTETQPRTNLSTQISTLADLVSKTDPLQKSVDEFTKNLTVKGPEGVVKRFDSLMDGLLKVAEDALRKDPSQENRAACAMLAMVGIAWNMAKDSLDD